MKFVIVSVFHWLSSLSSQVKIKLHIYIYLCVISQDCFLYAKEDMREMQWLHVCAVTTTSVKLSFVSIKYNVFQKPFILQIAIFN